MIGMTYEQIIERIKQEKKLSDEEINSKIKDKLNKLSDLISKQGAAHILANELGVNLYQGVKVSKRCKIKDLMPMMRNVDVLGKVVRLYEVRTFIKNNEERKIGSFLIGDETGKIRIVIWDEKLIQKLTSQEIKEDSIVLIKNAYVRNNNNFREVHLGAGAELDVNPEGETVGDISPVSSAPPSPLKKIEDLQEGERVKVYGTLVNIFEPKFYNACPECNKKVTFEDEKYHCPKHGIVKAKLVPIINIFLDDGTDNIRVTFFRDVAKNLLKIEKDSEMEDLKDNAEKFRELKNKVMLEQLEIDGRVTKNQMFDRLELSANFVKEADPKEIAKTLQ